MAGIGISLNKIFGKNTLISSLYGFAYSSMVTVAPMFVVIGCILVMGQVLGFSGVGYVPRELFACTVLYIFIFGLLSAAPFNAVLSKYLSDIIFEERYDDILPCYYVGMLLNLGLSCLFGIPFCIHEYFRGGVALYYVFTGFCGYISLVLVFYSMLYMSIFKDYKKISLFFTIGMAAAFLLSMLFAWVFRLDVPYSMLLALSIGFLITGSLEFAMVMKYFKRNSNRYRRVFYYFRSCWKLVVTNFAYTLGLYIHNFVFWTTDMRMTVVDSFVCNQPYDMASCLAMFTNISASVIFIVRIEMHFHQRYKAYSEAVIGGRGADIQIAKKRMFGQLIDEIMNLVRIQFIISVVVYLICIIILPGMGFSGLTLQIYPSLAAGYFILFIMYAAMLFLYYFSDFNGAMLTSVIFCLVTLVGSIISSHFSSIWYGMGLLAGTFAGWTVAFVRLRWVARHLDEHIFCRGTLLKRGRGVKPSNRSYSVYEQVTKQMEKEEL